MALFSVVKFFSGFNIFQGDKLAKLIFYAILIIVGIGIYHKVFVSKSNVTKIEKVEKQIIYQDCPDKDNFVGVKIWKFRLGLNF